MKKKQEFKLKKTYPSIINSKQEAKEAVKEYGLNLCKCSERLKNDKSIIMEALNEDPFAVMYVDEEIRKADADIKKASVEKNEYLDKYCNPLAEVIDFNKNSFNNEDLRFLKISNDRRYEIEEELARRLSRLKEIGR